LQCLKIRRFILDRTDSLVHVEIHCFLEGHGEFNGKAGRFTALRRTAIAVIEHYDMLHKQSVH
jgi:hypothetical protein